MLKSIAVAAAALLLSAPVNAQNTPAATPTQPTAAAKPTALTVGDKAPALSVEKWVKGEPITGFEKGKVYVVEFWATWCGPCIKAMPHLSEIQKEYKDKGLTVIGLTTQDPGNTLDKVEKMVKDKADTMGYTVAWDKGQETNNAYMKAAGQNGIPCSFVINREGQVAYIGHPMGLDAPLKEIVAGTHDIKAAAEKYRKEQTAEKESSGFTRKYQALLKSDTTKAYELGRRAMDTFAKDSPQLLNEIAWFMVDPIAKIEKKDLDLAMKAAVRADELSESKNPAIIDTLARVYFCKGDTAKALELQKKAVALAPDQMKTELEDTLKEYEKAKK